MNFTFDINLLWIIAVLSEQENNDYELNCSSVHINPADYSLIYNRISFDSGCNVSHYIRL